jgi:hypothetical protein
MPVVLASILVFLDTAWILIILVPGLFHVYFNLQLYAIRAKTSANEWMTFALFMVVGYITVLLHFEE